MLNELVTCCGFLWVYCKTVGRSPLTTESVGKANDEFGWLRIGMVTVPERCRMSTFVGRKIHRPVDIQQLLHPIHSDGELIDRSGPRSYSHKCFLSAIYDPSADVCAGLAAAQAPSDVVVS